MTARLKPMPFPEPILINDRTEVVPFPEARSHSLNLMPFPNARRLTDPFTFYSCFKLINRAPELDGKWDGRSEREKRATRLIESTRLSSVRSGHRSSPNLPQHRTWFGATTSQDCESTKMSFWNSGGCGRVLVAIIRRWREQRIANFRIHLIHCYSLFLVAGKKLEFP